MEKKNTSEDGRLYFDASEVPALTFSPHSLSWFFRVMQLEAALICSQRFHLFLHTKEHINLSGSSDISMQHLDFTELHQLPCQIVLPHHKPGQQGWGSEQMMAYCCKYVDSNYLVLMGDWREMTVFRSTNTMAYMTSFMRKNMEKLPKDILLTTIFERKVYIYTFCINLFLLYLFTGSKIKFLGLICLPF